jgi:hypothetical protein
VVGYSGHERGVATVSAVTAKGAKMIEKSFTLDRTMKVGLLFQLLVWEGSESRGTYWYRFVTHAQLIHTLTPMHIHAHTNKQTNKQTLTYGQGAEHAASLEEKGLEVVVRDARNMHLALGTVSRVEC